MILKSCFSKEARFKLLYNSTYFAINGDTRWMQYSFQPCYVFVTSCVKLGVKDEKLR